MTDPVAPATTPPRHHAVPTDPSPLARLRAIVAILRGPGGCPWDREQTHASLRGDLLEETYEVLEAITDRNDPLLREELGDFLLQVVMHSQIAAEEGRFTLDEVAAEICEKLVRRHPHVFGPVRLADTPAVLRQWDEIKRAEKAAAAAAAPANGGPAATGPASALDGVSRALPALIRATKIQKKAGRVGFDWPAATPVFPKVREELDELAAAVAAGDPGAIAHEAGDLLFAAVNLIRKLRLDAEIALLEATGRFADRFKQLEAAVAARGQRVPDLTLAELDEVWETVKRGTAPTGR